MRSRSLPSLPERSGRPCSRERRLAARQSLRGRRRATLRTASSSRRSVAPFARQVVARKNGERLGAGAAPPRDRLGQEAMHGARRGRVREVPGDVGMRAVEIARGVAHIGLFGDRQRDDLHARIAQRVEQRGGIFRRHQQRKDRADDAQPFAGAVLDRQRVEPVLRGQCIARVGAAQRCAHDAPAPIARSQAIVDEDRLVRP